MARCLNTFVSIASLLSVARELSPQYGDTRSSMLSTGSLAVRFSGSTPRQPLPPLPPQRGPGTAPMSIACREVCTLGQSRACGLTFVRTGLGGVSRGWAEAETLDLAGGVL